MPEKIYILMRFFLRVDRFKVKVYDTRIYYEVRGLKRGGNFWKFHSQVYLNFIIRCTFSLCLMQEGMKYFLRMCSRKEADKESMPALERDNLVDPNQIDRMLRPRVTLCDQLAFPEEKPAE